MAIEEMQNGRHFLFKCNDINYKLSVYGTSDKPYFKGSEIARFLGYVKPEKAIKQHVWDEYKKSTKNLLENLCPPQNGGSIYWIGFNKING